MPQRLSTSSPDFESGFETLLAMKREASEDVELAVKAILWDVRQRGDQALAEFTLKFDGHDIAATGGRVPESRLKAALAETPRDMREALTVARDRIVAFHERQRPADVSYVDPLGARLGLRWTPVLSVGLYVPGGTAAYPSSVLMNAVPAFLAGVPRVVMAVPATKGELNPLVLAAAELAGVREVYTIGGAQAVAALAFGTRSIAPVAKVVGPGNAYVAAAKRQVYGHVGIDSIAGPSEVLIIADKDNDPAWIAADLLAQAEHDAAAQSILMTDDAGLADAVEREVGRQLAELPRSAIAGASWRDNGAILLLRSLAEAPALADRIAAEHLELLVKDPDRLAGRIANAGAIFLGPYTPEAIGDYVGGPNHVLPTARSARFSSGLGVIDFMKRTTLLGLDAKSLRSLAPAAMTLAHAEGLEAHRRSLAIRLEAPDRKSRHG